MKKLFSLVILWSVANFAQEIAVPIAQYNQDGISISSYDFINFEPMLHQQNDTVYVINFWATWCAPCVKELPYFEKINANYKGQNVRVLLVSLDMKKQISSHLLPIIKRLPLRAEVIHLHDPNANAWIEKVDTTWSGAIPATLIYSRNKRLFFEQTFTYDELEQQIKLFLN